MADDTKGDSGQESGKTRSSTHWAAPVGAIVAAVLTAVGAIVAAIILASKPSVTPVSSPSLPIIPDAPPPPSAATSLTCAFAVTAPADNTKISAAGGALFEGTACESDLIWLVDFDPTDGYYYQVNPYPVPVVDGKWSFHNAPIGNAGDKKGTVYPIVALRVSAPCSEALRGRTPDSDGTVRFKPMPAGCPDQTDKVNTKTVRLVNDGP